MATTVTTVYTYPLDGTTTEWPINFEYLARRFVVVTLIGQDRKELVLNSDYRFITATSIKTTKAWGEADDYTYIEIKRVTSATDRVVTFSDGSILRATDLNLAQIQTMHVAEEARNAVTDTIGTDTNGNLDARARRIVNVADAVEEGDAINLRMMEQWDQSALSSANASAASAAASKQSASESAASAASSLTSAQNAAGSASSAATSATNSANSASASESSNQTAYKWANNPEDTVVNSGQYSSYHWANKSAKSANSSAASATAAAGSASASAGSASEASGYADRAEVAAEKLENINDFAESLDVVDPTNMYVKYKDGWSIRQTRLWADEIYGYSQDLLTLAASKTVVNGPLDGHAEVISRTGMFKAIAPSGAGNAHLWFYHNDETTRAIIYADNADAVHIQAGNVLAATFAGDGTTSLNGVNINSMHSAGQIVVEKAGAVLNSSAYSTAHIMLQTDDGGAPAISFHRGGQYAVALYLSGSSLFLMDSAGANREVLNNENLASWLVNYGDGPNVGAWVFCRSDVTATYGTDVSGANLQYGSTGANGSALGFGTWRSRGWAGGGNHTLFQRVA
ncbi:phage tail fiber protein [Pseudomonas sp. B14(2017)]|uniref:phage tail fiber domain-containing protein n=1 Tax=Pseudomonas sp. B14(2017) TaxID=1981745 RepID=UPI000A1FA3F4|nr:phage tail fiber protein [Pseudomonas sp. B14(2017)]